MHLLDRSCVSVEFFLKLHATLPSINAAHDDWELHGGGHRGCAKLGRFTAANGPAADDGRGEGSQRAGELRHLTSAGDLSMCVSC